MREFVPEPVDLLAQSLHLPGLVGNGAGKDNLGQDALLVKQDPVGTRVNVLELALTADPQFTLRTVGEYVEKALRLPKIFQE
jgi:hypothetical protein